MQEKRSSVFAAVPRSGFFQFLLLTFCLAGTTASAQSTLADSLAQLLKTAPPDTRRVTLLTDLAWEVNEAHPDSAASLLQEALNLAQRLGDKRGEATAWNGLGTVDEIKGDYTAAGNHYQQALALRRSLGNPQDVAATLNNLGLLHESMGDFDHAIQFQRENLQLVEEMHDTARIARAHFNLAGVYQEMGLYPEAQTHLNDARLVLEDRHDPASLAKAYTLMGHIQLELASYSEARDWYARSLALRRQLDDPGRLASALSDYANALDEMDSSEVAIDYYRQALTIWEKLEDADGIANVYANLGDAHKHLGNYILALQYLKQAETIRDTLQDVPGLMETYNNYGDVYRRMGKNDLALAYTKRYDEIAQRIDDKKYIQKALKDFATIYAAKGDFKKAYDYRVQYDEYRYKQLDEQKSRDFARKEVLFADQRKQQEIERQQHELALRDALISRSRTARNALIGGALALALLVALLFSTNRVRAKANKELAASRDLIAQERERADALLRNILPDAVAAELKTNETVKPVRFEAVTVLFSDFEKFTTIAEQVAPEALIAELDECFRLFDSIIELCGLEKIKTIGDAYMCAGGVPQANATHAADAVRAAIAMQIGLQTLMRQKAREGKPVFEMRIGIHTGPVVAGVVGSHKFAYDIWGDTVNTAARLEQGSLPGKINISETTYQVVKNEFPCTFRGHLPAKNKGEIAMYFVDYQTEADELV